MCNWLFASAIALLAYTGAYSEENFRKPDGVGPQPIVIDFFLKDFSISNSEFSTNSKLSVLGKSGRPALKALGDLIYIPNGYDPTLSLKVSSREFGNTIIKPYQTKYRCEGVGTEFEIDEELYRSQSIYPQTPANLTYLGQIQGHRIARLGLYPLRQNFKQKSLLVHENMTVTIDFVPNARLGSDRGYPHRGASPKHPGSSQGMTKLVKSMVKNKDAVPDRDHLMKERLVIVMSDASSASMQPLIDWKRQKGLHVDVFKTSEIGTSRSQIKEHLVSHYQQQAFDYLLLVGGDDQVPTNFRSTSSGFAASDYPYSLLEGDDQLPDISVGRLVANDPEEVAIYVQKIIDYEKGTSAEADWLSLGTTIASDEGERPSDEEYAQAIEMSLIRHSYAAIDRFYQGEGTASPEKIQEAIRSGRSWITYIGHGSGTAWGSTNDQFRVSHVESLDNLGKLPIIVDVACTNGSFVRIDNCFGKAWMVQGSSESLTGAVAYYGASVSTTWDPPAVMAVGAAKYHHQHDLEALGPTLLAGQFYLIEEMGLDRETIDNMEWYNLFGDPSMMMRTKAATRIFPTVNSDGNRIEVWVKDAAGQGIAGLLVAYTPVEREAEVVIDKTDSDGFSELSAKRYVSASLITISGYNIETRIVGL